MTTVVGYYKLTSMEDMDPLVKLHRDIRKLIYTRRVMSLDVYRKAHEQCEKGELSKEAFQQCERAYERQEDSVAAMLYRLEHGPKRIFAKLVEARKKQDLSQADVADLAGISVNWYALLEQGHKARMSPKMKQKVADALGVPYEELFSTGIAWWGKKTPEEIDALWKEEERKRKQ